MKPSTAWPPAAAFDAARNWIVVVEHELVLRFVLSDGLRDEGYHVIEACNADEALAILGTVIPDMMITAVRMPGSLDGLQLLRVVKSSFKDLPVILVSGHMNSAEAIAEGAARFVAKPYLMETVVETVRDVLGKST